MLLWGKLCSSSHVGFHALLCDVTALARSWTSSDGWFRGERPADRRALEGAVAKAGSVASRSSRESRDSRERARTQARRFKLSGFWTSPTGGWSNQSIGTGRSPACTAAFARHFHVTTNKLFTHVLKLLSGLHIYNITTFVILLIHTFLQPFMQV